jgi:hypothetical protein
MHEEGSPIKTEAAVDPVRFRDMAALHDPRTGRTPGTENSRKGAVPAPGNVWTGIFPICF